MKQLFSNNARTTVAATFGATDTTLEVLDGSLFPVPNEAGQFFLLTLLRIDGNNQETGHEVIKCNARVGNSITVEQRAYEGAAASEFAAGAVVSARLTAKSMENLIAASIAAVELIYDNFDDRYLGAKAADPVTDNDEDPLEAGSLYFNTTALIMRVYNGTVWQDAASAIEGLGQTFQFTATAGQAEFSGNDDSGAALTFDSVGNLMVFLNGARLVRNIDYSVNDVDKIITLIKPAADLDVLTVDAFSYFAMVPLADMPLAIAGQDNQSLMTPLRTAQAINATPMKNLIINGNKIINHQGSASLTELTDNYNYETFYYDGTYVYVFVEDVNVREGVFTLSWESDATAEWQLISNATSSAGLSTITTGWAGIDNAGQMDLASITDKHLWVRFAAGVGGLNALNNVQLEKGGVATDFEYRSIEHEKILINRHIRYISRVGVKGASNEGGAWQWMSGNLLSNPVRATPSTSFGLKRIYTVIGSRTAVDSANLSISSVGMGDGEGAGPDNLCVFASFTGVSNGYGFYVTDFVIDARI